MEAEDIRSYREAVTQGPLRALRSGASSSRSSAARLLRGH